MNVFIPCKSLFFTILICIIPLHITASSKHKSRLGIDTGYASMYNVKLEGERIETQQNGVFLGVFFEYNLLKHMNLVLSLRQSYASNDIKQPELDSDNNNNDETSDSFAVGTEIQQYISSFNVGTKFTMDSYNVFPYFSWGVGPYLNLWETDEKKGGGITVGVHGALGADYYLINKFAIGFEFRYDWLLGENYPSIVHMNLRFTVLSF